MRSSILRNKLKFKAKQSVSVVTKLQWFPSFSFRYFFSSPVAFLSSRAWIIKLLISNYSHISLQEVENISTSKRHARQNNISLQNCWVRSSGDQNVYTSFITCMDYIWEDLMFWWGLQVNHKVIWLGKGLETKATSGERPLSIYLMWTSFR